MFQAVHIAQRGFFGSACGNKYCEVSIFQSDKSFVARNALEVSEFQLVF